MSVFLKKEIRAETAGLFSALSRKILNTDPALHFVSFRSPLSVMADGTDRNSLLEACQDSVADELGVFDVMFPLEKSFDSLNEPTFAFGVIDLMLTVNTGVSLHKHKQSILSSVGSNFRMLTAGPSAMALRGALEPDAALGLKIAAVQELISGIKDVFRVKREVELLFQGSAAPSDLKVQAAAIKTWLGCKPPNWWFAYATGLGGVTTDRADEALVRLAGVEYSEP